MRQVLIYRGEDGFWIAECPSLPGCVTQASTSCSLSSFTRKLPSGRTSVTVPSNSSSSSFAIQLPPASALRPMAGVAARLVRTLEECNISDAVWLPRRGFRPGGGLLAILARVAALVAVAWSLRAVAVIALVTAISAAVSALLVAVTMRSPAIAVAGILLRGPMGGALAGAAVDGRDCHPDQPLEVAQERRFLVIAERDRYASAPARAVR